VPSDQSARRFLLVMLIASLLAVGYVAWPIATALLSAAVLAVVLAPVQARLSRWLRGRRAISAGILVLAVVLDLVWSRIRARRAAAAGIPAGGP